MVEFTKHERGEYKHTSVDIALHKEPYLEFVSCNLEWTVQP